MEIDKKINKEVEVRSFIDDLTYGKLIEYFDVNSKFIGEEEQINYYFNCKEDLRLRIINNNKAKLVYKSGKIHDNYRDEIEVNIDYNNVSNILFILKKLNINTEIKWERYRRIYKWNDIKVCIDDNKGYGNIIELEKLVKGNEDKVYKELYKKLKSLNIQKITTKQEFNKKFEYYKNNWKKLLKNEI